MSNKYDNWLPMPRFLLRKNALSSILKSMNLHNKKCLEIGFGAGEILKLLAAKEANVTGFDFSQDAAEMARQRISGCKNNNKINIKTNIDEIEPGEFDVVLALEVLEHIEDDKQVFSQWLKYLKPGGSLILSVPAHMAKWGDNDVWAGHYRRYEKIDLISMCEENNVSILKFWNYGYPITIILDKLLHGSKKNEVENIKNTDISNDELSKQSGIKRDNKLIYRLLSNDISLFPFYVLQKLFYTKDFGSGYILHIQKK